MAANAEPSGAMSVEELRQLETRVLKTLCLTINTAGSELKYKILDSLSDDDFYFPVTKAVYQTLYEMHRRGDYVISANLEEELRSTSELPADFVIDHLFDGPLASLAELGHWVMRLKERSRSGMIPSVKPSSSMGDAAPTRGSGAASRADATVVKSLASVKRKIAEEHRRSQPRLDVGGQVSKSSPRLESPEKPPEPPREASSKALSRSSPSAVSVESASAGTGAGPSSRPAASSPSVKVRPDLRPAAPPRSSPSPGTVGEPRSKPVVQPADLVRASAAELSSEGDDWDDYLETLARKQGRHLETGFAKLDEALGGLTPGLWLLVDEDRDRLVSFLKQLTDQIASRGTARCLFLAGELPKTALRLRTLARLAGVPAADIEKGRLKKESKEWLRIEAEGRKAAAWLKRVFVHETPEAVGVRYVRALVGKLLEGGEGGGGLVVVDSLERISSPEGSSLAKLGGLKALAEDLQVVVAAASSDSIFLSSKEADYASVFRASKDCVEMDVLPSGKESARTIRFVYSREIGRFAES